MPEVQDETAGWSAQKLYTEAKDNLNEGNYERAVKLFETLEARYPFGRYAQQAQLEVAYAYYKDNEPISAIAACDRFIKLHPNHPNVDYAYYLKGLANFNEDLGLLGITAEGVARLERLEQLDGAFVVAVVEVILGFGIQFLCRPARGLILDFGQQAAAPEGECCGQQHTAECSIECS